MRLPEGRCSTSGGRHRGTALLTSGPSTSSFAPNEANPPVTLARFGWFFSLDFRSKNHHEIPSRGVRAAGLREI